MSQDEITVMDGGKCILQTSRGKPFFSNKYDITKHKQYKNLSDYEKNIFDIEKYMSRCLALKKEQQIEHFDLGELSIKQSVIYIPTMSTIVESLSSILFIT